MKAIIPVAGAGTRLRPFTYTQPKALIPVAGKTILAFIIDQLQELGVKDFVFVVGYLGDKIRDYVEEKHKDIHAEFAVQSVRKGLGHAIWTARDFVNLEEEVLIVLGDTIIEADLKKVMEAEYSSLGVKKVEDPRNFGVAEIQPGDAFISKVVEKPRFPRSNMALVGFYRIKETRDLFQALDNLVEKETHSAGEIQLTDALMAMIDNGTKFTTFRVDNWYDCGKADVLLETNAKLLKKVSQTPEEPPRYDNTIIVHPVHIAPNVKISNSIIGPNVTIGEDSEINYSILQESIIGNFAQLNQVILKRSVIGSDAIITGFSQSLNIGDNTEIDLSGDNN